MVKFNVSWNRYDHKFKCIIGYLEYDGIWHFYYDKEGVIFASKIGFVGFPEFKDIEKEYESKTLFSTFDTRIRRINYQIDEENKIELLLKTQGALATDNITIEKSIALIKGKGL